MTVKFMSVGIHCLGHFMSEAIIQVATACLSSGKETDKIFLSRQLTLLYPVHTELLILKPGI